MSDLISRKAVIELISGYQQRSNCLPVEYKKGRLDTLRDIKRDISNNFPTAYNVDGVVLKLETLIGEFECNLIGDCEDGILSIVKGGAVK